MPKKGTFPKFSFPYLDGNSLMMLPKIVWRKCSFFFPIVSQTHAMSFPKDEGYKWPDCSNCKDLFLDACVDLIMPIGAHIWILAHRIENDNLCISNVGLWLWGLDWSMFIFPTIKNFGEFCLTMKGFQSWLSKARNYDSNALALKMNKSTIINDWIFSLK